MTQFGRALHALNIDIICANSSQAKGRVERANGTLQDRLVKEMRLRGIDTVAAGNAFLPTFMADYNARFAKAPFDERNLHRPLAGGDDLDDAFVWEEDRTLSKNLTLQYDKVLFILEPNEITRSLALQAGDGPRLSRWPICHPAQWRGPALSDLRQATAGQPGRHCREQTAGTGACLYRREAEGTRHVAVGQGAAATWPAQAHVQGRIGRSKAVSGGGCRYVGLRASRDGIPSTPQPGKAATHSRKSDISNWREK